MGDPNYGPKIKREVEKIATNSAKNMKLGIALAMLIAMPTQALVAFYSFKPVMHKLRAMPTETKSAPKTLQPVSKFQF
jgi:hypothetical protein